jgi:hypothetical protein
MVWSGSLGFAQLIEGMIMADTHSLALAGGAIAASLIDTLHSKGILTLTEAREILDAAMYRIPAGPENMPAKILIGEMLRTRFSARGQEPSV